MTGMSFLTLSDKDPVGVPALAVDLAICALVAVATVGLMLLAL